MSGNVWRLEAFRALFWMHFVAAVLIPFFTEWGGLTLAQVLTLNAWFLLAMGIGLSRTPIASSVLNARTDAEGRATLLSTVSMLRTLAICIVNPVAGALADRSLGTAMGALGVATLAVAVLSPLRERHLAD